MVQVLALLEHPETGKQVSDSLERCGHHVLLSNTFHKAIDILLNRRVGLIISDVHVKNGGSVFDFMRWVQSEPTTRDIPFVCFSTHPSELAKYVAEGLRSAARFKTGYHPIKKPRMPCAFGGLRLENHRPCRKS